MSYPFSFTAIVYDGYNSTTNGYEYILCSGISFADSYSKAASIIENYYSDNLVAIKEIRLYEEDEIIPLPDSIIRDFIRNTTEWEFCNCDTEGTILEKDNTWGYRHINSADEETE